jgi:hypothetical protein
MFQRDVNSVPPRGLVFGEDGISSSWKGSNAVEVTRLDP